MSRAVEGFATKDFSDILRKIYKIPAETQKDFIWLLLDCVSPDPKLSKKASSSCKLFNTSPWLSSVACKASEVRAWENAIAIEPVCRNYEVRLDQFRWYVDIKNSCNGCGAHPTARAGKLEDGSLEFPCSDRGLAPSQTRGFVSASQIAHCQIGESSTRIEVG